MKYNFISLLYNQWSNPGNVDGPIEEFACIYITMVHFIHAWYIQVTTLLLAYIDRQVSVGHYLHLPSSSIALCTSVFQRAILDEESEKHIFSDKSDKNVFIIMKVRYDSYLEAI